MALVVAQAEPLQDHLKKSLLFNAEDMNMLRKQAINEQTVTADPTPKRVLRLESRNRLLNVTTALLLVTAVFAVVLHFWWEPRSQTPAFETPHQAVLLSNGSVYFGKLDRLWTRFPVMSDVYYVQSVSNPDTQQKTNVLVKRGSELHAPNKMILNAENIVLIEPVSPGSRIAQLIAEQKR